MRALQRRGYHKQRRDAAAAKPGGWTASAEGQKKQTPEKGREGRRKEEKGCEREIGGEEREPRGEKEE